MIAASERFWSPEALRSAAGGAGRWLARPVSRDSNADSPGSDRVWRPVTGVSIDSRTVRAGEVFIAIRGETHDGHDYAAAAVKRGAGMVIVDHEVGPDCFGGHWQDNLWLLKVDDTRKSLIRLATQYRQSLPHNRVIAVTGSNGKTTTKQLLLAVLSTTMRGAASVRSFNNDIGVPLTILSADPKDQFLICEVGTSAPGEIAHLASVIKPDVAVMTSIGRVHLEGLGSLEGVAREKASMLHFVPTDTGWAAVTADSPILRPLIPKGLSHITCGFAVDAGLRLTRCELTPERKMAFVLSDRTSWTVPLMGAHHAANALFAIAVGRRLGVSDPNIQAGLDQVQSAEMRFSPVQIGRFLVLNDAYNANPESMAASIRTFARLAGMQQPSRRPVLVLGDMLELGAEGERLHHQIASVIHDAWMGPDAGPIGAAPRDPLVILVGRSMASAWDHLQAVWRGLDLHHFPELTDSAMEQIAGKLDPTGGDMILIKGSRGMALERLLEPIRTVCSESRPSRTAAALEPVRNQHGSNDHSMSRTLRNNDSETIPS